MTVGPPDPCLGRRKGVARPTAPTPRGNRAAIYARVSTSQQVDGTSLPTQLAECDATASRRDLTVVDKFVDAGRSGADASRPELDRMLMAREGLIDVILVAKLDRLGRSLLHLLSLLVELDALSVQVVSISEGFDTSTAVGRLQLSILGSVQSSNANAPGNASSAAFTHELRMRASCRPGHRSATAPCPIHVDVVWFWRSILTRRQPSAGRWSCPRLRRQVYGMRSVAVLPDRVGRVHAVERCMSVRGCRIDRASWAGSRIAWASPAGRDDDGCAGLVGLGEQHDHSAVGPVQSDQGSGVQRLAWAHAAVPAEPDPPSTWSATAVPGWSSFPCCPRVPG